MSEVLLGGAGTLVVAVVSWLLSDYTRKTEAARTDRARAEDLRRQERVHLVDARKDAYAKCLASALRFRRLCAHRQAGLAIEDEERTDADALSVAFDDIATAVALARLLRRETATEAALEELQTAAEHLLAATTIEEAGRSLDELSEQMEETIRSLDETLIDIGDTAVVDGSGESPSTAQSPAAPSALSGPEGSEDPTAWWDWAMNRMRAAVREFTAAARRELQIEASTS